MFTTEAKYVTLSACCAQVIWMRTQLLDYGYKYNRIPMYCDSKRAIAISCNPVQHSYTKHIDIRYYFIKEHVEKGTMELYFVGTEYQLADLFTKALPTERFEYLVHRIEFIMAQLQRPADVHQDELCVPNKRYALMDANKKIDLYNLLYLNERKIMANIIQNDPLRFSIAVSSSVPWIYLGQFWHTLQEDRSKYRLKFMLDRKELTLNLNDFRRIFHLPQDTDNNHERTIMNDLFMPRKKFNVLAQHLQEIIEESLPTMVDDRVKELTRIQVSIYVVQGLIMERQQSQANMEKMILDAIQQECENILYEITSQINDAISNHIPSQDDLPIWLALKYKFERLYAATTPCRPYAVRLKDLDDPRDDAHPEGENSAKSKAVNEMLRQRCTSGDEHQYHIDKMQNFLKNDIVWKSKKEIIVTPHPQRSTPIVQGCQRDPKALTLSLVNQDLLYLKKGSSRPEKIVRSFQKFHAVIFLDDDIEERTSRWCQSGSDYKNINKNDIKDMYLLIVNHKLGVESYQQKVNHTTPTITFPGIQKFKVFSIVFEPVYDIIYKNNKKEKRAMRHQEVCKFCDAMLKRVLKGLKSYKNDVKHGYVTQSLSNEDDEYLLLFAEEIKEWLKRHDQMRH
nr:ribonuclease H [Tanacetum cinerariifolium]